MAADVTCCRLRCKSCTIVIELQAIAVPTMYCIKTIFMSFVKKEIDNALVITSFRQYSFQSYFGLKQFPTISFYNVCLFRIMCAA